MPFRSQQQWRWAFGTGQPFARRWARETPGGKNKFRRLAYRISKKAEITPQDILEIINLTTKADEPAKGNAPSRRWNATGGETIYGNLGRDAGGRFTNTSASGSRSSYQRLMKKPKKGTTGKKPTQTAEQRAEEREKKKFENGASGMEKLGYEADAYQLLDEIKQMPADESALEKVPLLKKMFDDGLLEVKNGKVLQTSLGRSVQSAVERGNVGDAVASISRAEQKREDDEAKKRAQEDKKRQQADKKPKGGSGGSKKPKPDKKPKPQDKPKEEPKEKPEVTQQANKLVDEVEYLTSELDNANYTPNQKKQIQKLIEERENTLYKLTGETVEQRQGKIRQAKVDSIRNQIKDVQAKLAKAKTPREKVIARRLLKKYNNQLEELGVDTTQKSAEGHVPPAGVRSAARRGLELRAEFNRGGTMVGVARARDLSNGKSVSDRTIKRMVSYFARHAVDKRPDWSNPSDPSPGYVAWLLWGGDAGRSWANKVSRQIDARKKKVTTKHAKHDQSTHGRRRGGGKSGRVNASSVLANIYNRDDAFNREITSIVQSVRDKGLLNPTTEWNSNGDEYESSRLTAEANVQLAKAIQEHYQANIRDITKLTTEQQKQVQEQFADDVDMQFALAMWGDWQVRERALELLGDKPSPWRDGYEVTLSNGQRITVKPNHPTIDYPIDATPRTIAQSYYPEQWINKSITSDVQRSKEFANEYLSAHAQHYTGHLGSHMAQAASELVPNQTGQTAKSFYPDWVSKPPSVHPDVKRYLNDMYQETQQKLRQEHPSGEVYLYRADGDLRPGLAKEPWSTRSGVADAFQQKKGGLLREGSIPIEYVLATHKTHKDGFGRFSDSEAEYLMLGIGVRDKVSGITSYDKSNNPRRTIKSLKNTNKVFTRTSIFDVPPPPSKDDKGLYLEQPFDMYANYRITPKKKRQKASEPINKALIVTTKHGKHDQKTHGRRRGGGKSGRVNASGVLANIYDRDDAFNATITNLADQDNNDGRLTISTSTDWNGVTEKRAYLTAENSKRVEKAVYEHYQANIRDITKLTTEQQRELQEHFADDVDIQYGLAMWGDWQVRERAHELLGNKKSPLIDGYEVTLSDGQRVRIRVTHPSIVSGGYQTPSEIAQKQYPEQWINKYATNDAERSRAFQNAFLRSHAAGDDGHIGANSANAVAQLAPNQPGISSASFYPDWVSKPPSVHPDVKRYLNDMHQETQRQLRKDYPDGEVYIYRADGQLKPGLAKEPWSTKRSVADTFQQSKGGNIRQGSIPIEYVLATHKTHPQGFSIFGDSEAEYLVLGIGVRDKVTGITTYDSNNNIISTKNTKEVFVRTSIFDVPPPPSKGDKDLYLEEPFDMYANYRITPKKKRQKASEPTNKALWRRAIAQAKRKFDVYPSAYANGWAVQWYERNGGKWSSKKDLRKWFKEEWVDISKPIRENGKIVGYKPCGSGEEGGYPKCLPKAKAMRLSDIERRRLIARKRRAGLPKQGKPVMTSSDTDKLNS